MANELSITTSELTLLGRRITGFGTGEVISWGTRPHRNEKTGATGLTEYSTSGMRGNTMTLRLLASSSDSVWLTGLLEREKEGYFVDWYGTYTLATGEVTDMRGGQVMIAPGPVSMGADGASEQEYEFKWQDVDRDVSAVRSSGTGIVRDESEDIPARV